jgi:hypothetical protein
MQCTFSKRIKKNDHTIFNSFTIDHVHVKSLIFENQINLHDDHSIDYHLRFNYLTCVAWTFE